MSLRLACAAALLGCAAAASGTLAAPSRNAAERPDALAAVDYEQRLGNPLPHDARFRDETGRAVAIGDYLGRHPVVLVPAYYRCPMLCTLVLDGVVRALRGTGDAADAVEVVVVSIDPAESPAEAAARKAELLGDGDGRERWHLLTGEEAAIRAVTDAVGFRYAWDEARKQWAHPAGIVVVTPDGRVARYLFGIEYAPRDLRLAIVEASAGRLGSVVDRLLLFCYAYDPAAGAYGLVALRAVQVGGALTALALATFITLAVRRERRVVRGAPGGVG
ncbi:MAG TPA: SCO family protein [Candidatus Limnocylindria bacterium]|nr:SCO family protein [Candidatus Limnocylindria bacterium]